MQRLETLPGRHPNELVRMTSHRVQPDSFTVPVHFAFHQGGDLVEVDVEPFFVFLLGVVSVFDTSRGVSFSSGASSS